MHLGLEQPHPSQQDLDFSAALALIYSGLIVQVQSKSGQMTIILDTSYQHEMTELCS